jgi:hypothetical protein
LRPPISSTWIMAVTLLYEMQVMPITIRPGCATKD